MQFELLNVIKRAIILESGNLISAQTIYQILEEEKELFNHNCLADLDATQPSYRHLGRVLITDSEAHVIIESLARNQNNKTKTAKELGLTRGQLDYRLRVIKGMIK